MDNLNREISQRERRAKLAAARFTLLIGWDIQDEFTKWLWLVVHRPKPFTMRAFFVKAANPNSRFEIASYVGVRPIQWSYLRFLIDGGIRRPKRRAIKLPTKETPLDTYGNIPRRLMASLVAKSHNPKSGIFYGRPSSGRQPLGIYRRVGTRLIPIIILRERPVFYLPRLPRVYLERVADRVFWRMKQRRWEEAWEWAAHQAPDNI
jgi:hypothetical protein